MTNETLETINQAKITVTFYSGSSDEVSDKLSKKYIIKNWKDETNLRGLLDEIAKEMSHLSGYGILTIEVRQFSRYL